ncbi:MAG TPA: 3'-5' exonuclease [bacterium]|nr:3'-5' exonuclease [bacterium]
MAREYVIFDLETGGLELTHPVIQLAATAVDDHWQELESYQAKIQFDARTADPEALTINHYDPAVWANEAKSEAQVVAEFGAFLKRHATIEMTSKRTGAKYFCAQLIAYNAAFDKPRLDRMYKRHNAFLPAHPRALCALQRAAWWAVERNVTAPDLKLTTLAAHLQIPVDGAHDALVDTRLAAKVMERIAASTP